MLQIGQTEFYLLTAMIIFVAVPLLIIGFMIFKRLRNSPDNKQDKSNYQK